MHTKAALFAGLWAVSHFALCASANIGRLAEEKRDVVVKVVTNVNTVTKHVTVTVRPGQADRTPALAKPHPKPTKRPQAHGDEATKPRKQKPHTASKDKPNKADKPQKSAKPDRPQKPKEADRPAKPAGYAKQPEKQQPDKQPGGSYQQMVLHHHNIHRANHSAPPMTWSPALAATAEKIATSCHYAHSTNADGGGYGQNIAAGTPPKDIGKVITGMFYNGEVGAFAGQYGKEAPSGFEHWGHFSQVVWKASSEVGCATRDCHGQGLANVGSNVAPFFTVCNYKKPGNFGGQYAQNVGKPLGRKTVRI